MNANRDYIYRNSDDTVRVSLATRAYRGAEEVAANREWDADIFYREPYHVETYSECGDVFYSKAQAKEWLTSKFGKLTSIQPENTVTEGWERDVKWALRAEGSAVSHYASYRGFNIWVTNWKGSRTLWYDLKRGEFTLHREADRAEHGVNSLKERLVEMVDELIEKESRL